MRINFAKLFETLLATITAITYPDLSLSRQIRASLKRNGAFNKVDNSLTTRVNASGLDTARTE